MDDDETGFQLDASLFGVLVTLVAYAAFCCWDWVKGRRK